MVRHGRLRVLLGGSLLAAALLAGAPPAVLAETIYIVDLTGDQEVPGPGDPDGTGFAELSIQPGGQRVCASIVVADIAEPVAAHIHAGEPGVAGGVVVTLPTPSGGEVDECVDVLDEALLQAIVDDPGAYYVNVHTADFPAGAIRGQLAAIEVGSVTVAKFVCPPEIQSIEDLEAAGPDACPMALTEAVPPPEGYSWSQDPFIFPELAISVVDDLGTLTLEDSEPGEGGTVCDSSTLICLGSGGRPPTWPHVVAGLVEVYQDTMPAGYALGAAEVLGTDLTDPELEFEVLDDGVAFTLDPVTFSSGVLVRLYDFAIPAGAPGRLIVEKFACPEGVESPDDVEGPLDETCRAAVGEGRVPPLSEGNTFDPEPLVFDIDVRVSSGDAQFDLDDADPSGDTGCDPVTGLCIPAGGYAFEDLPSGDVTVREATFPDGYRFGWAEVTDLDGNPVAFDLDADSATVDFELLAGETLVVTIVDVVGAPPAPTPVVTPPPTAASAPTPHPGAASMLVLVASFLVAGLATLTLVQRRRT